MSQYIPRISHGCMHIHTTFSDGSGTVDDVIAAGQEAGLDWLIITDHNTLAARRYEGWHDGLLVLVGHEITPITNHFLAFETAEEISASLPAQQFVDAVYAEGGFGVIAHPDDHMLDRTRGVHPWDNWDVDGPSERGSHTFGLEIWNWMADWRANRKRIEAERQFTEPQACIDGPTEAVLAWWDALNRQGKRTFAIGGLDAHAFNFRRSWGTVVAFPYTWMFRTLTDYLLLDAPLADDLDTARAQLYSALRQGRSYMVNGTHGTLEGIPLRATRDGLLWFPGDSPTLAGGPLTLHAQADQASLRLIGNGETVAAGDAALTYIVDSPGFYRLEGRRNDEPWLFTNPIYVQA